MKHYTEMTKSQLNDLLAQLNDQYKAIQAQNLSLDMSRGKPGKEQLDLSEDMLHCIKDSADCMLDGVDTRNYGIIDGLPSIKKLFADLLDVDPSMVIVPVPKGITGIHILNRKQVPYTEYLIYGIRAIMVERPKGRCLKIVSFPAP